MPPVNRNSGNTPNSFYETNMDNQGQSEKRKDHNNLQISSISQYQVTARL